VYRRPDRHWLLQSYVWQDYDIFPNFPALKDFLAFWENRWKARCSQSLSHIPRLSSLPSCTPSTASSGCIDPRSNIIAYCGGPAF
jgi:Usg-like family